MNVSEYMGKDYKFPQCWELVADVFTNEVTCEAYEHWKSLRPENGDRSVWFSRASVSRQVPFDILREDEPSENYDVYYMIDATGSPHVGVWYEGSILHATLKAVLYEPEYSLDKAVKIMSRWRYAKYKNL